MSYGGRETRRGRVEEENNQNYRKLNQNYQKFILLNDNSNNLRGNQKHPKKSRTFSGTPHSLPRSKEENMIVTFRKPVEGIRGKIRLEDGFYIRKLYGKYVVQRCPNRKGHVATEKERENRLRFIQQYRRLRQEVKGERLEVKGKEI